MADNLVVVLLAVTLLALAGFVVRLWRRSRRLQSLELGAEHRHAQEVAELHLRTVEALAVAIDAKENATPQHLKRVVVYSEAIGRELHLAEDELRALKAAALLHDIGKLAVPEYIISKPGSLTEEEFEKMKTHTVVGAEILERVQFPYPVVPIVRSHHERWNGTGYPDGLKGVEIPIGARILAVVDSFNNLASDQQGQQGLSPPEAVAAMRREAGEAYDPFIVEILDRLYPKLEAVVSECTQSKVPAAGLCVESARDASSALDSIAQARQELQILYQLTQALGNSLSLEETLHLLAGQLQKLIHFEAMVVYLLSDGELTPRFVEGVNASLLSQLRIPLGQGLSGGVAENGKCSLNGNPAQEPGYTIDPRQFSKLRSALSVPLDSPQGIIGALTLYSMREKAFTVDHLRILKAIGAKAGSTINNALIHEAIGKRAETDGLTGLPNARALASRLEQETARAARQHSCYTVFVIDLNGLKRINDRHGHLMGNKVIQAVGNAVRECLREYDLLARMGGDEFVLLLPGMDGRGAVEKRVELTAAVQKLAGFFHGIEVSISMGAASYPADSKNSERLLGIADRRMYGHKRRFYSSRTSGSLSAAMLKKG